MSFNTSHFPPVPFGHLTFLFYTAPKSQCHYICPTLYIRKPGNIKDQPMPEKHYFVVLFILSILVRGYFTSEIIFALYKPYCKYKEKNT